MQVLVIEELFARISVLLEQDIILILLAQEWDVQKVLDKCVGENGMMKKVRASNNPECPSIQFKKGWQKTCHLVGNSMRDKYLAKKYQEVIAISEEYPEALDMPVNRIVYGAALWCSNQEMRLSLNMFRL